MLSVTIQFLSLNTKVVPLGSLESSWRTTGEPKVLPPLLEGFTTRALSQKIAQPLTTTAMVLSEVASTFSPRTTRSRFVQLYREMRADPTITIVPVDPELFERGIDLYAARSDKDWSLVDCISFAVMEDSGITEALTGDHHFVQAGFKALLG